MAKKSKSTYADDDVSDENTEQEAVQVEAADEEKEQYEVHGDDHVIDGQPVPDGTVIEMTPSEAATHQARGLRLSKVEA